MYVKSNLISVSICSVVCTSRNLWVTLFVVRGLLQFVETRSSMFSFSTWFWCDSTEPEESALILARNPPIPFISRFFGFESVDMADFFSGFWAGAIKLVPGVIAAGAGDVGEAINKIWINLYVYKGEKKLVFKNIG